MSATADATRPRRNGLAPGSALRFVVLLGGVALFGDMTYEGARGIIGPFLGFLGASAVVVGMVSGAGELLGYTLRLVSGYVADRTHRYWTTTILGYAINLLAVPLLALVNNWWIAAALIVLERTGRAIRKPAGDAMLSHAASQMGQGWGFGLREAMDQTGAVLGPLLMAFVLARRAGYHTAFALLVIPATLSLVVLIAAQRQYPHPEHLEVKRAPALEPNGIPRAFWKYLIAGAFIAAGTVDFPLAAYHFAGGRVVSTAAIPLLYAVAMLSAAVAAPLVGRLYDRRGLRVLAAAALVPAASTPLLFLGGAPLAAAGAALWGVGMSVQDATVRAAIADLVPSTRRASAYGYFDSVFGVAWFAGSALMGALYNVQPIDLVEFSVGVQLIAAAMILSIRTAVASPQNAP